MDFLKPESWPRAPGFSWGVAATGRLVFVAGQVGRDPAAPVDMPEGMAEQCAQAFRNLVEVLAVADAQPGHIAHMTWYVTDLEAYRAEGAAIGQGYKAVLGKHFPSMTMVQVGALVDRSAQVEIECIAVVPQA